jgi:hypothetical protein
MRAYEFMTEEYGVSPSHRMTLRDLHKKRLKITHDQKQEQEINFIRSIMYSDNSWKLEALEIARLELELAELRASINKTETETAEVANMSNMALSKNAKSGIDAAEKSQQKLTKLTKSGIGRSLKV